MTDGTDPGDVTVSDDFFTLVLPGIQDLAELKLVLHVLQLAHVQGTRGIPLSSVMSPHVIRSVVGLLNPEPAEDRLRRVVDRAVVNGSLVRLLVLGGTEYVLPGTRDNLAFVDDLQRDGDGLSQLGLVADADVVIQRPNVFSFYERHIGPLTPLIAEQLRDTERSYPPQWIEEAILAAVQYNKRNWRYVESILNRWEENGGPHGITRRRP